MTAFAASPLRRPRRLAILLAVMLILPGVPQDAASAQTSPPVTRAAANAVAPDAPGYPWQWPVAGRRAVIAPFRAPAHDYGPGHRGMDIAADAEVLAPADGVVAFRDTVVDRPLITIDHGGGYVTTLEPVTSELRPGDAVAAGESVGVVAVGGHVARGTLHVGVRVDGRYVNPRGLFGGVPRAVLLPCCDR